MVAAVLTQKGQTTIPKKIREFLNLEAGDRIEFIIQQNGKVVLMPATIDVKQLRGMMPKPKKAATLEDIEKSIRMRAVKQWKE